MEDWFIALIIIIMLLLAILAVFFITSYEFNITRKYKGNN